VKTPIYILGGYQTDFARNWTKESKHISAMFTEVVTGALEATGIDPKDVEVGHVGNFAAELYAMQGHLGAFLVDVDPAFSGLPTARHEAACASGSIAILAASAELEAERYDLAMVVGVEQMKTVDSARGGDFLGTAAWYEREAAGISYPFPKLFGRLGDEYDKRFGLKDEYLAHISAINYANAKKNPLAQTRGWYMSEDHARSQDRFNQVIGGRIKVSDCSQITARRDLHLPGVGALRAQIHSAAEPRYESHPPDPRLGPPHRAARIRRQGCRKPRQPLCVAAHTPGDPRCIQAGGHPRRALGRRDRDP